MLRSNAIARDFLTKNKCSDFWKTLNTFLVENDAFAIIHCRWCHTWSKPEGLEVRLLIRPAMKSEATNQNNRYSLKRVPNYF